jgi:hypothetical protein
MAPYRRHHDPPRILLQGGIGNLEPCRVPKVCAKRLSGRFRDLKYPDLRTSGGGLGHLCQAQLRTIIRRFFNATFAQF